MFRYTAIMLYDALAGLFFSMVKAVDGGAIRSHVSKKIGK